MIRQETAQHYLSLKHVLPRMFRHMQLQLLRHVELSFLIK